MRPFYVLCMYRFQYDSAPRQSGLFNESSCLLNWAWVCRTGTNETIKNRFSFCILSYHVDCVKYLSKSHPAFPVLTFKSCQGFGKNLISFKMSLAISQHYIDSVRARIKNKLYIEHALTALLFMRRMNKNELELNASAQSATLTKMHSDVVESQWASKQLFAMSKASWRAKRLEFVVQTFDRTIPGETPALYSMHLWKTSEEWLKGVVNSSDCFSYDSYENCNLHLFFASSFDGACNEMSRSRVCNVMLYIFGHKAAFLLRMYDVEIGECVRLRASVSFYGMSCYIHVCHRNRVRINIILSRRGNIRLEQEVNRRLFPYNMLIDFCISD